MWRAWTDSELLPRWCGPKVETILHGLDVALGGQWLTEMTLGGKSNHQRVDYTEVTSPGRLAELKF